jgi:hypothetical protein
LISIANRLLLYLELMAGRSAQQIRQSFPRHKSGGCSRISIHGALVRISSPSKIRIQEQHEELSPHNLPEATAMLLARRGIGRDVESGTSPGETRSTLNAAVLILNWEKVMRNTDMPAS